MLYNLNDSVTDANSECNRLDELFFNSPFETQQKLALYFQTFNLEEFLISTIMQYLNTDPLNMTVMD